jgi:hypothetical protein
MKTVIYEFHDAEINDGSPSLLFLMYTKKKLFFQSTQMEDAPRIFGDTNHFSLFKTIYKLKKS